MTFEEFKMIAAQKSQEEDDCVYFIREYFINNFSELFISGVTKCSQPNMVLVVGRHSKKSSLVVISKKQI